MAETDNKNYTICLSQLGVDRPTCVAFPGLWSACDKQTAWVMENDFDWGQIEFCQNIGGGLWGLECTAQIMGGGASQPIC